jgi:hypothetical protein
MGDRYVCRRASRQADATKSRKKRKLNANQSSTAAFRLNGNVFRAVCQTRMSAAGRTRFAHGTNNKSSPERRKRSPTNYPHPHRGAFRRPLELADLDAGDYDATLTSAHAGYSFWRHPKNNPTEGAPDSSLTSRSFVGWSIQEIRPQRYTPRSKTHSP